MLLKKANGTVDGFVVENHQAGGHNAPPRERGALSELGEPVYGSRDQVDLSVMRGLGVPFWLAGSMGSNAELQQAKQAGANGIQVGTLFAFCEESGITPELKSRVLDRARSRKAHVYTSPSLSPTSYPFKMVELAGTLSEPEVYAKRERICDLGYLRSAYHKADGQVGFRCPGEPVADFVRKGGEKQDTESKICLCNCLFATIGLGQLRNQESEPALITSGSQVESLAMCLPQNSDNYSAKNVIEFLKGARESL